MGRAGDGRLGQEEAISLSDRQNHSGSRCTPATFQGPRSTSLEESYCETLESSG